MIGETSSYIITDQAGLYVAGRRVATIPVGQDGERRLDLTEEEARYELLQGSIVLDGQYVPPPVAHIRLTDTVTFVRDGITRELPLAEVLSFFTTLQATNEMLSDAAVAALSRKLDGAAPEFLNEVAALAGIPAGWARPAKVGGRRSIWMNDGGTLVDMLAPAQF